MTKKSLIDIIAERVSQLGNCEVVVHRLVDPNKDRIGRPKVGMYSIEVKQKRSTMRFGDFRVGHAKKTLAMIADILEFGLIKSRYPTEDAYMAVCRANHWKTAQLRFHGIEPIDLTKIEDITHYPPEDFDFKAAEEKN